ncbi:hypothetical protein [Gimesia panareensis]|uniref:Uncharacterized protein n=1 Tax=Gimesia panareensis TaxID=2527978 RepID=A0A517QA05_9PLAN|nr:hypothetical protein [Gimesia panareensis]QDT28464.1 hypothetical protein Enr10x_38080 [Gimesia panareensis]QDU51324.1 hypothetical protein Pan110_36900 [Gimesia panareensis]
MSRHKSDANLLNQFVDCFGRFDDLLAPDDAPQEMLVPQSTETWDSWSELGRWLPLRMETEASALEPLYQKLPGPLPQLYEQLVLHWRWLEVDLGSLVLRANPPGPDLEGLEATLLRDPVLTATLLPAGYVPFGRSAIDYDPLCFDLNAMNDAQDCPIIQFEHEAILCHAKIGDHEQRWPSFRDLITEVVARADV